MSLHRCEKTTLDDAGYEVRHTDGEQGGLLKVSMAKKSRYTKHLRLIDPAAFIVTWYITGSGVRDCCSLTSRRTSVDFLGVRTLDTASFSAKWTAVLTLNAPIRGTSFGGTLQSSYIESERN